MLSLSTILRCISSLVASSMSTSNVHCGPRSSNHMWTPPDGKRDFGGIQLIECFHMSGLLMRDEPAGLDAVRLPVPNHQCGLFALGSSGVYKLWFDRFTSP